MNTVVDLQTAETSPSVQVWTNDIQAACAYTGGNNATATPNCYFNYQAAATPSITAVYPRVVTAYSTLTIVGSGLDASATVAFGNEGLCSLVSWNSTTLTCTVPNLAADGYNLSVVVNSGGGIARMSPGAEWIVITSNVASVSPMTASACGGEVITFVGTGLPALPDVEVGRRNGTAKLNCQLFLVCTRSTGCVLPINCRVVLLSNVRSHLAIQLYNRLGTAYRCSATCL